MGTGRVGGEGTRQRGGHHGSGGQQLTISGSSRRLSPDLRGLLGVGRILGGPRVAQLGSFQGTWHSALRRGRRRTAEGFASGALPSASGVFPERRREASPRLSAGVRVQRGVAPAHRTGLGGAGRLAQTRPAVSPAGRPDPFLESSFPLSLGVKYAAIALESVQFPPTREVEPPGLPSVQWPVAPALGARRSPERTALSGLQGPGRQPAPRSANASPGAGLLGCKRTVGRVGSDPRTGAGGRGREGPHPPPARVAGGSHRGLRRPSCSAKQMPRHPEYPHFQEAGTTTPVFHLVAGPVPAPSSERLSHGGRGRTRPSAVLGLQ